MIYLPTRQFLEAVSHVGCDPVTCGICRRPRGDFSGCSRERVIRPLAAEQCDTDCKSLESDSPNLLWCGINAFKIKR
jgi:hypothetical protein